MDDRRQFERTPTANSSNEADLYAPSLQNYTQPTTEPQQRPWRLWSQVWIAFFGGVLPYIVVAYLNGKRLGLAADRLRLLLFLGVAGFLTTIAFTYSLNFSGIFPERPGSPFDLSRQDVTLGSRIIALIVFAIGYQIQKSADRRYHWLHNDQYSSLWVFGLIVTIGLGFLQNILIVGLLQFFL